MMQICAPVFAHKVELQIAFDAHKRRPEARIAERFRAHDGGFDDRHRRPMIDLKQASRARPESLEACLECVFDRGHARHQRAKNGASKIHRENFC
jgi:hypothetical protein